jgi:hypothetical protein
MFEKPWELVPYCSLLRAHAAVFSFWDSDMIPASRARWRILPSNTDIRTIPLLNLLPFVGVAS